MKSEPTLSCCKKLTIRQILNVLQYFNGQSMAIQIACVNPRFTLEFARKCWFCAFNESTDDSNED